MIDVFEVNTFSNKTIQSSETNYFLPLRMNNQMKARIEEKVSFNVTVNQLDFKDKFKKDSKHVRSSSLQKVVFLNPIKKVSRIKNNSNGEIFIKRSQINCKVEQPQIPEIHQWLACGNYKKLYPQLKSNTRAFTGKILDKLTFSYKESDSGSNKVADPSQMPSNIIFKKVTPNLGDFKITFEDSHWKHSKLNPRILPKKQLIKPDEAYYSHGFGLNNRTANQIQKLINPITGVAIKEISSNLQIPNLSINKRVKERLADEHHIKYEFRKLIKKGKDDIALADGIKEEKITHKVCYSDIVKKPVVNNLKI